MTPGIFTFWRLRERVRVPPDFAAEMVPFDPSDGEFRIHYAGFFDPGFGYGSSDIKGTRAVLEVRAHEVPFLIEHGQFVGRLTYMPLFSSPEKIYGVQIGSSYQQQALALSKQFRRQTVASYVSSRNRFRMGCCVWNPTFSPPSQGILQRRDGLDRCRRRGGDSSDCASRVPLVFPDQSGNRVGGRGNSFSVA